MGMVRRRSRSVAGRALSRPSGESARCALDRVGGRLTALGTHLDDVEVDRLLVLPIVEQLPAADSWHSGPDQLGVDGVGFVHHFQGGNKVAPISRGALGANSISNVPSASTCMAELSRRPVCDLTPGRNSPRSPVSPVSPRTGLEDEVVRCPGTPGPAARRASASCPHAAAYGVLLRPSSGA